MMQCGGCVNTSGRHTNTLRAASELGMRSRIVSATRRVGASSAGAGRSSGRRSVQVFAKGKGARRGGRQQRQMVEPPTPPIDPENEEFVMFARPTTGPLKSWYPFTVMVGGSQANILVKARENEITKRLTSDTLAKTLGVTLYKEREKIESMIRERVPFLKHAKGLEYAFKIRNKDKPKSWYIAENLEIIPAEEDCKGVVDKLVDEYDSFMERTMSDAP